MAYSVVVIDKLQIPLHAYLTYKLKFNYARKILNTKCFNFLRIICKSMLLIR